MRLFFLNSVKTFFLAIIISNYNIQFNHASYPINII